MTLGLVSAPVRRSSCLPFQLFWIETLSFLPNAQSDRGNLPGYGQTSHGRLHPRGQQGGIEISGRTGRGTGPGGGTVEQILQLMIVILIEAAEGRLSLRTLQLAASQAVFPAGPGPQPAKRYSPLARVRNARPLYAQSCRLVRNRWGVWIKAISCHFSQARPFWR